MTLESTALSELDSASLMSIEARKSIRTTGTVIVIGKVIYRCSSLEFVDAYACGCIAFAAYKNVRR